MAEELTTAMHTPETATADRNAQPGLPWFALLACWARPATIAPRLARLKLRWAYLIHLLAGLAFFLGFLLLAQIDVWNAGQPFDVFGELAEEFTQDWEEAGLITAFTVLSIEAGFVALALIVLPWGAADERLRSSWAHALRFTWLHTTHAVALLLVIGPAILVLSDVSRSYRRTHPMPQHDFQYPPPPVPPPNATPGSQAMKDFQKAQAQWQREMQELNDAWWLKYRSWQRTQPFLVQHDEAIITWLCIAGSAWILWALFRSVGARRAPAIVGRPPTCEFCGYNLTGTAIDSRCPECGTPAIDSLGPHVRTGTDWDRGGGLLAWWRCGLDAVFRPDTLGRQIQVTTQPRRFRSFCWSLILSTAFVGMAAVPIGYVLIYRHSPLKYDLEILTIGSPISGACSGAGMLMIAMLIAGVVGMIQTWQNGRNLLPAAAQVASYLSLLFLAWGLFMAVWITLFCAAVEQAWFRNWMMTYGPSIVFLAFSILVGPQLVWLAICFVLVWKGTAAARYANK